MAKLAPLGAVPLGDCAVYIEFSKTLDLEVNSAVQRLAAMLYGRALPWVRDVVPSLGGIAIHFDPDHADVHGDAMSASLALVSECLKQGLPKTDEASRTVEVPVCYEAEFAPDLTEVAAAAKVTPDEAVALHAASEFRVLMIGFAPGHAYMGGLHPKLAVPRRATPRPIVPAGSVAIANDQTVVYPYAISGGWNIIGRTPLTVFDAERESPSLFAAGDRVRFKPISRGEFLKHAK
ncbi:MAG TPA: 5-oxoprolinase subunit PxpB [Burkholderiales bacterium]|nr:5-oxoprolinase subunit PxpB [Burkholderiales bacterium]